MVVLAHGFPELAYSWRHQIPVLAEAGYHVLAPDQRGYGGSSRARGRRGLRHPRADRRPRRPARRRRRANRRCSSATTGARMVVWHAALLHPDRVRGGRGPQRAADSPGPVAPHRTLAREVRRRLLHAVLPGARPRRRRDGPPTCARRPIDAACSPGLLGGSGSSTAARTGSLPHEFDHYVTEFSRTGFTGSAELVPQLRPQLGADAAAGRRTITVPCAVRRRHRRPELADDEPRHRVARGRLR